ncbi:MAG TPA: class I SAM-dependent methyltransferase, partial [Methyloradius sp.]
CASYTPTQYDLSTPFGQEKNGYRSENLEAQTFPDASFDLVVTQDVFEHLFDPAAAIKEIARTLKPGGLYVMTVPILNKDRPTRRRASLLDGEVVMHGPVEYHGNPISGEGSLVTMDWGYDIADFLFQHSGMFTTLCFTDDILRGIRAEYIEVVVCRKPSADSSQIVPN